MSMGTIASTEGARDTDLSTERRVVTAALKSRMGEEGHREGMTKASRGTMDFR